MGNSSSFYCTSIEKIVVSDFKTIPCMLADPETDRCGRVRVRNMKSFAIAFLAIS